MPRNNKQEHTINVPQDETRGDNTEKSLQNSINKELEEFDQWLTEHGQNLDLNAATTRIRITVGSLYKLVSIKETDMSFAVTKDENGNEVPLKLQWTPMQFLTDKGALISTKHFVELINPIEGMPQLGATVKENLYFMWWCEKHKVAFKCLYTMPETRTYNGTTTTSTKFAFQPIQL